MRYIEINSALVSAQNRERFYVHNCGEVGQPKDRGILLKDVLESGLTDRDKAYCLKHQAGNARDYFKKHHTQVAFERIPENPNKQKVDYVAEHCIFQQGHGYNDGGIKYDKCPTLTASPSGAYGNKVVEPVKVCEFNTMQGNRIYDVNAKSCAVTAQGGGLGGHTGGLYAVPLARYNYATEFDSTGKPIKAYCYADGKIHTVYEVKDGKITIKGKEYPIKLPDGFYIIRKLTVTECRRLQTIPNWYKMPCSDTQNYKMLGNGWTIEVIKHILSHIPEIAKGEPIEVLSMYDGMSCGRIALKELGANIVKYYATEIDKYAIQTTQANFPDTIQLGDAFQVREWSDIMEAV